MEFRVAFGTLELAHCGKVRLQAVITEQMFAAGMRWQNRIFIAIGALGCGIHHWQQLNRWFRSSPQPRHYVLQVVEV